MASPPERNPDATEALALSVQALTENIEQLRREVRRIGQPVLPPGEVEVNGNSTPASYAWVSSLEPPVRRRPTFPRILLELLFLAACATAAGLAKLDAAAIVGVMAGAWVLVALIEWAASRADRGRSDMSVYAPPVEPEPLPADPSWYIPPVEHTMIENAGEQTGSITGVTKLPPATPEIEATIEA